MAESESTYDVSIEAQPGPVTVRITHVPTLVCGSCGDIAYRGDTAERAELLASKALVERGCRFGGVLRFARKTLGYRAADLAAVLGVSNETVSRWENEHHEIDPSTWATLGALVADTLGARSDTLKRLESARERPVPSDCEIRFDRSRHTGENVINFIERIELMNAAAPRAPQPAPVPVPLNISSMSG